MDFSKTVRKLLLIDVDLLDAIQIPLDRLFNG